MQYNRTRISIEFNREKQLKLIYKKNVTVFEHTTCNNSSISTSGCMLCSSCNREKQFNLQKDVISTQAIKKVRPY